MNRRSIAVLNKITLSDSYVSVQELAAMFNVSRRSIYNDLDKINYWLRTHHLSEVKQVHAKGLYLDDHTKQQLSNKLSKISHYEFSKEERRAWIFVYLVGQSKPYFLEGFIELFQVSRNTVLEDIRQLKEQLEENRLQISTERKLGYQVNGNENDVRRLLIYHLSVVTSTNPWHRFITEMDDSEALQPYSIFSKRKLFLLRDYLNEYEKQIGIEFTDEVLNNLVVWFDLFIYRISQKNYVRIDSIEKEVIHATDEFRGAELLATQLSESYQIKIPVDEVYYFAKYLLSAKVNYNLSPQMESQEMKLLCDVVEKMVRDFQIYAAVAFPDQQHMIQNLLLHLKPAFYRIKYGITIDNLMLDSIKDNYSEVFHLTKKVIHHFEDLIDQPVHENEIGFIAIHFGGWLRKEGVMLGSSRKRLLIVCTNGLGTSRLLESQLEGLFSDVEIVGVSSLREYERNELSVDFIVSTISLSDKGIPVFVVNPVLNNEDKEQLLKKVNSLFRSNSKRQSYYSVETVMDMVKRYTTIHDNEKLRQELRRYFYSPITVENQSNKPSLRELLSGERIVFTEQKTGWEEGIKKASEALLKQGFIKEGYIEKMIQNINERGPYVVISKHIALPHAAPNDGVIKTGFSLLFMKDEIDLLGKPVRMIIILASIDNEQHLKALSQLTKMLSNKSTYNRIMNMKNKDQLIKLIRAHSAE